MRDLKQSVAELREDRVKPADIYTREVIDGMIEDLKNELSSVKEMIQEERSQLFRMLAIAGSAITVIILIAQHVTIH